MHLDPGIYLNLFPATLSAPLVPAMVAGREAFPDLRPLRTEIAAKSWNLSVFAAGNSVYGYGPEMGSLTTKGFREEEIDLKDHPLLASRLIIEGLIAKATSQSCVVRWARGRTQLVERDPHGTAANGRIKVFLGYDLRAVYWQEESSPTHLFGVVVDALWSVQDHEGRPLSPRDIAAMGAMVQVGQIQGEYLPGGSRINTEVARIRWHEQIQPFVTKHQEFQLPTGGTVQLETAPVRVILGEREE